MSRISIVDLEVFYRVGVPDAERAQPQRLLLTVEMEFDFSAAAKTDSIADTIDYFAVSQRLLKFGDGKSWKLIEKLAADIADCDSGGVQAAKRLGRSEKICDSAGAVCVRQFDETAELNFCPSIVCRSPARFRSVRQFSPRRKSRV